MSQTKWSIKGQNQLYESGQKITIHPDEYIVEFFNDSNKSNIKDIEVYILPNEHKDVFVKHNYGKRIINTYVTLGGSINPNGPISVNYSSQFSFQITPDYWSTPGDLYVLDSISGSCGGELSNNKETYITNPVINDCDIYFNFKLSSSARIVKVSTDNDGKVRYRMPNGTYSIARNSYEFPVPRTVNPSIQIVPNSGFTFFKPYDHLGIEFDHPSSIYYNKFTFDGNYMTIDSDVTSGDIQFSITFKRMSLR